MLGNYLQQTTLADDIFRCIFFLEALRVKDIKIKDKDKEALFNVAYNVTDNISS